MKRIMLLFLVFTVCFSSLIFAESSEQKFSDITDHWGADWVGYLVDLNITSGYKDGTFRPNNEVKGAEVLSFTLKSLGYDVPLDETYWANNVVKKGVEVGLINESPLDPVYTNPERYLSREDAARIIFNAYLKNNSDFNGLQKDEAMKSITDISSVNGLCLDGVIGTFSAGIVQGYSDKSFKPQQTVTRAEVAVMISRLALPDKRVPIESELPSLGLDSNNNRIENVKFTYSPVDHDLGNIVVILDTGVNADRSDDFATMEYQAADQVFKSSVFESESKFNAYYDKGELEQNTQWSIALNQTKQSEKYSSDIMITIPRSSADVQSLESFNLIFNYLFKLDTERMAKKLTYHLENLPDLSYTEVFTSANGRDVYILSYEDEVKIIADKIPNYYSMNAEYNKEQASNHDHEHEEKTDDKGT